jgi:hypothetical protein
MGDCRAEHTAWLRLHRLVPDEWLDAYWSRDLDKWIVYSYPYAHGPQRALLLDQLGWFTVLDDLFDGPLGRDLPRAQDLLDRLVCVTRGGGDAAPGPVGAWADIWARVTDGMSTGWRDRFAADWTSCLDTFRAETRHRCAGTMPTVREAVPLRRHASAFFPAMNMLERLRRAELPDHVHAAPGFRLLRAGVADIGTLMNDVFSLPREENQDAPFNTVVLLCRERGHTRAEALAAVRADIDRLRRECVRLRDALGRQFPECQWYLRGTAQIVNGVYRWSRTTGRYRD